MSHQDAILLIDQGGHSTRAILFALNGEKLAQASCPVEAYFPKPRHAEMDLQCVLQSIDRVLDEINVISSQLAIKNIVECALVVQRSSFVVCQRDNLTPVSPIISWMDTRNADWLNAQKVHFPRIQQLTGLYPNAHYALSKIPALLEDAKFKKLADADNILFAPLAAYLAHYLCQSDAIKVDAVIASRTLLMDLSTCQWQPFLLQLAGINENALPQIVNSNHAWGEITVGSYRTKLSLCGGDQSFVAFSAGMDHYQDYAFINMGSGAFIQTVCEQTPASTRLLKSPLAITDHYRYIALEGTVNAAASALDDVFKWREPLLNHDEIEQALLNEQDIPIYLNTSAGTGSPYWLAAEASRFSHAASLSAQAVAALESVVFALCDNLSAMQQVQPLKKMAVSGGLAQSDQFCQRLADCAKMELVRFDDHEAASRGAAFFMLNIKNAAHLAQVTFKPQQNAALFKRYELYQQLMDSLCQKCGEYQSQSCKDKG